jgi:PD-(D/E)XK nuclease superfamily protein
VAKRLINGTAAEHLVCADLLLAGHKAFLAPQICSYDVIADISGKLYRIQVKSVKGVRSNSNHLRQCAPVYQWSVRKRNRAFYGIDEFDLIAFVALDTKRIAYGTRAGLGSAACFVIRSNDEKIGKRGQVGRIFSEFSLQSAIAGQVDMRLLKANGKGIIS